MTNYLDREGIFKAKPVAWKVKKFDGKNTIAIAIELAIVAQLDGQQWTDWRQYDQVHVWGDWFVMKKDGQPNTAAIEQLATSLGWDGSLRAMFGSPPDRVVQITVKAENYNGETYHKATWMNPEDFVPTGGGANEQEVGQLEARFGSLLRAAAGAGAKKAAPAKPAPKPAEPEPAAAPAEKPVDDFGDIPF